MRFLILLLFLFFTTETRATPRDSRVNVSEAPGYSLGGKPHKKNGHNERECSSCLKKAALKEKSIQDNSAESEDDASHTGICYDHNQKILDPRLISHLATYKIELLQNYDQNIIDVDGKMTIQILDTGNGYAFEQRSTLNILDIDGDYENVHIALVSWESQDGKVCRFYIQTTRNGIEEQSIRGVAKLGEDGSGIVTYTLPQEEEVTLPKGTLFPIKHLQYVLGQALKGETICSNVIFDGSTETQEPVAINCVIGHACDSRMIFNNPHIYHSKQAWPIKMAIYSLDSKSLEPEYEISQNVMKNAVIRDMVMNMGSCTVKATLTDLKIYDN